MNDYLNAIRHHYADFSGRARRREYWMFMLVNWVISILLYLPAILAGVDPENPDPTGLSSLSLLSILLFSLYTLGTFIPYLAINVRRLHDMGKSGLWVLLSFIPIGGLIILFYVLRESQPGANKWGPNPKGQANVWGSAAG